MEMIILQPFAKKGVTQMSRINFSGLTKSALRKLLFGGVALGVLGGVAMAQVASEPNAPLKLKTDYLGYSAGVSARAAYTDNVNLRRDGLKDGEFILSTVLTGGAIVSTPRVTALALGDLDFSYLIDDGDFVVNQNVGATSTFTGVDNWFYVDASGSTTRQLAGDNARFSSNLNVGRNQRVNVHSYSASPYIYHRMPDQSSVELRYRFSQVFVDRPNRLFNPFGGGVFNDSTSHEALAVYESGGLLDKARFRLTAYGNDTTEDIPDFVFDPGMGPELFTAFEYQQGSVAGNVQVALSRKFSLSGAVGYDEVDTENASVLFFDDDMLSGVFWRAGFTAQPNRRSRVRIEYGERYGDDFIDADVFYELSKRFVLTAGANRSFRTRAQAVSSQYRSTARQTLDFADRLREGAELSARGIIDSANWFANGLNSGAAQTNGVAVSESAFAVLSGVYGRTTVRMNGFYSDDDFGFRQIETYGAGLNVRRQLSRRLNASGALTYRHADTQVDTSVCETTPAIFGFDVSDPLFDPIAECANFGGNNGVTNTLIGRIGASYNLYENASAFAEISHAERFAPNQLLEYSENTIMVGVTVDF